MKKLIMLVAVMLLAGCSDKAESNWVAQVIPKEEKQPAPVYEAEVSIHTPFITTTGLVIKQDDRDKWILVNATEVSGHPNVLVQDELQTLGEVQGIDIDHNIAIILIRNSFDFNIFQLSEEEIVNGIDKETKKISYYESFINGRSVQANAKQIQNLLDETIKNPLTWETRYEKNAILLQETALNEATNFTNHYEKNIFTYNPDNLKHFATQFIEQFNKSVKDADWQLLENDVGSDEMMEELQYVNKDVKGYSVREARKDGVFYFVNGIDDEKNEVRLTLINEKGHYKVIGTSLIDSEELKEQKIAQVNLINEPELSEVPALQMFILRKIKQIDITSKENEIWKLEIVDKKVNVQFEKKGKEKMKYSCDAIEIEKNSAKNAVQLIGCSKESEKAVTMGYIK
ncbi:hypothetical protein DCE79_08845 [Lysinibacillus sp. 2017]|uniref:hypothetical protein n=1 Tax=unclassified Lysinibacillus TaxID=2636778 RepID=UPI000D528C16|nr:MULTISPECIES: hypothetical protein [unclassified Lysinibacillus]AWE07475.1 hypothetical protein DCE79_08845 [Lysinibacillus sp. 2017]TGN36638.1 hypothetical protein E4L99_03555 [Lysinibacillus sp. S2017]